MSISAKELAAKLGVSPSSISLALNGRPGISSATRDRIIEAAKEYGIQPQNPKPAYSNTSSVIKLLIYRKHGLVFNDTAFFSEVLESINSSAAAFGCSVSIAYLYEADNISEQINEQLAGNAAGYILLATEMLEEDIRHFDSFSKPIVVLDNKFDSNRYNHIAIDNIQGARIAINHLISYGHRHILHITTDTVANNLTERNHGAYLALAASPECSLETIKVRSSPENSYHDIASHLRHLFSDAANRPTAIFAGSDMLAISCIRAAAECGINIPDDISIIGFDNIPLASMTTPPLSTVHVNKSKLGYYAVKRLSELISGTDDGAINIYLGTELIVRDSVKQL